MYKNDIVSRLKLMCLDIKMASNKNLEYFTNKINFIQYREMFLHYKYLAELNNKTNSLHII
jgi:hypothetical protein